jgi:hypothetical protein
MGSRQDSRKYTSFFEEMMNYVDDDEKPILFTLIPILEGCQTAGQCGPLLHQWNHQASV